MHDMELIGIYMCMTKIVLLLLYLKCNFIIIIIHFFIYPFEFHYISPYI